MTNLRWKNLFAVYSYAILSMTLGGVLIGVINTEQWLLDSFHQPIEICEAMLSYFEDVQAEEIYEYLSLFGMYEPISSQKEIIKALQEKDVWKIVHEEFLILQQLWEGPDIPIFIFPINSNTETLTTDFNGRAGLAFKDKLFLFVSEENSKDEINALLTHEYNHVCRLTHFHKSEDDIVLLDSIILEGLAEYAVQERFNKELLAPWISYYPFSDLQKWWSNLVYPQRCAKKNSLEHHSMMYGSKTYPKMLGYCVGYFLVTNFANKSKKSSTELLPLKSNIIAQI